MQSHSDNRLYGVTVVFNPIGFKKIYENYHWFAKQFDRFGDQFILYTVECAFDGRPFVVTDAENPHHVQVRTNSVGWIKENLGNIGISRLPHHAQKIAWLDADVIFWDEYWLTKTLDALDLYDVIQPWSDVILTGPSGEYRGSAKSFLWQYMNGVPWPGHPPRSGNPLWHPGFAWAFTRRALDKLGGLFDVGLAGAGDSHMAQSLIGVGEESVGLVTNPASPVRDGLSDAYKRHLVEWQQRAETHVRRNVGSIPSICQHIWHGRPKARFYEERWAYLVDNGFDPDKHLVRNSHGVYEWTEHYGIGLRDALRKYAQARNDDANTVD